MGNKATWDPTTKIIEITDTPVWDGINWVVDIDVQTDLYSDGKEDWLSDANLNKLQLSIVTTGGDPLPGSKSLGITYFIEHGWKIRPYEGDHVLRINGNLYSRDGSSPFIATVGSYNVMVINTVSNLVDSTVQQLQEIEYATYQNAVWVDTDGVVTGTTYPAGNREYPVNNIADAVSIANERGFDTLKFIGNLLLDTGDNVEDFKLIGQSPGKSILTIESGALTSGTQISEATVTGILDGDSEFRTCVVQNIYYINGFMFQCLIAPGTIQLGNNSTFYSMDCYSGVPGEETPTIDCGGSGQAVAIRSYAGGIKLTNKTGIDKISIDLVSGQVVLDNTVTNGTIVIRGDGKCVDTLGNPIYTGTWNGATIINEANNPIASANAVWSDIIDNYTTDGTFGKEFKHITYIEHYVYLDPDAAINGDGSQHSPFNSLTDAIDYAELENIRNIKLYSDIILDRNLKNFTIDGIGVPKVETAGFDLKNSTFKQCALEGDYTDSIIAQECVLLNNFTLNGYFEKCALSGDLICANGSNVFLLTCASSIPGLDRPTISMNSAGTTSLNVRDNNGGLTIKDCNNPSDVTTVEVNVGSLTFDSSCTGGDMVARGVCKFVNETTGATVYDETVLPSDVKDLHIADYNRRVHDSNTNTITLYEEDKVTVKQIFDTNADLSEITPQ